MAELSVGGRDHDLDETLTRELTAYNDQATGRRDEAGLSVALRDAGGELVGGLSGWTWGTSAGISLVWVREEARRSGLGARLLATAEAEAARRGCARIFVSSFTFQAPEFYQRHGYVEFARSQGIPDEPHADVHMVKTLG